MQGPTINIFRPAGAPSAADTGGTACLDSKLFGDERAMKVSLESHSPSPFYNLENMHQKSGFSSAHAMQAPETEFGSLAVT